MYAHSLCGIVKPTPNWVDADAVQNDVRLWVWGFLLVPERKVRTPEGCDLFIVTSDHISLYCV
jgi:hypothetical protein